MGAQLAHELPQMIREVPHALLPADEELKTPDPLYSGAGPTHQQAHYRDQAESAMTDEPFLLRNDDGGVTTLGPSPVTTPQASGYWNGVGLWPGVSGSEVQ